jgi:hypothetical protein
MVRRLRTLGTAVVAVLATAGIAAASGDARPCHPDLPGTHSLAVSGQVTGYHFAAGGTVVASVQTKRCAGVARWNYAASVSSTASVSCGGASSFGPARGQLIAARGNRLVRVVLAPDGVDRPDRLVVMNRATGRRIASWPLIDRPARVALYGGIAILSAAERNALYALRISDGRIALLGVARAGDRPIIGRDGLVYQDGLSLKALRVAPNSVALKFVPLASVERQLSLADRQIRTNGKITAVGMDGRRVAYAVRTSRCDVVKFWTPPWFFVAHVTHPSGPTCLATRSAGGVSNVAMGGGRLIWTAHSSRATSVFAASTIGCKEWRVARPAPGTTVPELAGDGSVLAYALNGSVQVVDAESDNWYGEVVSQSAVPVTGISVDNDRIATLYRDGTVTVTSSEGDPVSSFVAAGPARAIALRADSVAVLRSGHLDVYSAQTGLLAHSWPVPANTRSVGLHYGIAVMAAGDNVVALNVATGRTARLLRAPGRVATEIDSPGAVVQYNAGGHGHLRLIPMSTIEARTG